jgi:hypothetical protein
MDRVEFLLREAARLGEDRLHHVGREIAEVAGGKHRVETGDLPHGEGNLFNRYSEAHALPPGRA